MNNSATDCLDYPKRIFRLNAELKAKLGDRWSAVGPLEQGQRGPGFQIGATETFVPPLGLIAWDFTNLPETFEPLTLFSPRIYQVTLGNWIGPKIGYLRVPHYNLDQDAVDALGPLISVYENETQALVLDQVNNPGGSMFQMYGILSLLTDKSLSLPKHQFALTDDDAAIAADAIALADAPDEAVPPEDRPSPEFTAYSRFVLSEIEAGRKRETNPGYLGGVTEILPAKFHYTKKLFALINMHTYSAAEFFAAILQDNKRATLFGEKTAGLGGCARPSNSARQIGMLGTYSWTIGWRTNGLPIENLGVMPDIPYTYSVDDLRSGAMTYAKTLLKTILEHLS